jgi:hypothetical protein
MESNKQSAELSDLLNKVMVSIDGSEPTIKDVRKIIGKATTKIASLVNSNLD